MATMKLEVIPVPVSDIDGAIAFYEQKVGFTLDHDVAPTDGVRVVQLTPPGSGCSIVLGKGLPGIDMRPGSLRGLHLGVEDLASVRTALAARGVSTSEPEDMGGVLFSGFVDPDGNTWVLQQVVRS